MDMNSCLAIADGISDYDRDDLLERLDRLIAAGVPPQRAQVMAIADLLAEAEAEQAELLALAREQHPDAFPQRQGAGGTLDDSGGRPGARRSQEDVPAGPDRQRKRRIAKQAMPADEVRQVVAEIAAQWSNAPKVQVIGSMSDAPEGVRRANQRQLDGGATGEPAAFFAGGRVYIVAGQMRTRADVAEALLHEALGHYGLRGAFGSGIDVVLEELAQQRPDLLAAKGRQYGLDVSRDAHRLAAAEEVLAELAQAAPQLDIVQRAVAAIRAWLRQHMPMLEDLELSDAEMVVRFIEPARRFVVAGSPSVVPWGAVAFERAQHGSGAMAGFRRWLAAQDAPGAANDAAGPFDLAAEPLPDTIDVDGVSRPTRNSQGQPIQAYAEDVRNFWRWFGDSKVVDEQGRPMVVFHGTGADFKRFRPSKRGAFGAGIYFSPDAAEAGFYAEATDGSPLIIPVYLRLENPEVFNRARFGRMRWGTWDKDSPVVADELVHSLMPRGVSDGQVERAHLTRGDGMFGLALRKAMEAAGHDGLMASFLDGSDGGPEIVVFDPRQVKSAISNNGAFDPLVADFQFSRRTDGFTLRPFGRGAQVIEYLQDRYNRWKHAIEDVRKQGGTVTEANDFYLTEERYWGRVGERLDGFHDEVRDFVREVSADDLTLEDVATYAYAMHARERNEHIAAKNAAMPDGGSGMSTADAEAHLAQARRLGTAQALERHAATLQRWVQGTRDVLRDGGLIDDAQHAAWAGSFEHYVPLRGIDGQPEGRSVGRGFNIRGPEGHSAEGRQSQARLILERLVQDRVRALVRSGKNEVLRSLAQFVLDNPSPNLWRIAAVGPAGESNFDAMGERSIEAEPVPADADYVTVKDGGRELRIVIRDQRLLEQLKAIASEENPSMGIAALLWANRLLSRLYTSLSPVFTVINGLRDVQTAAFGIIDEIGFMAAPKLLAKMPKALLDSWRAEAGTRTESYQRFAASGGKTAYFGLKDLDARAAELQDILVDSQRLAADPRKFGPALMRLIEAMNGGIENATRLAAFEVAREAGRSDVAAASIAKNITVNFNRRGTQQAISAWVLFFNPAIQGSARIVQSLTHPRVQATLAVAMMGVAALALRNAGMGEDDDGVAWWDKIPDDVKERNIVIVLPPGATAGEGIAGSKTGRYVKVPMPYGYNFFAVVANQIVDVWRHSQDVRRGRDAVRGSVQAFKGFMNAWVPVGSLGQALTSNGSEDSGKSLILTASPDALDPLVQGLLNQSAFGRQMAPEGPQTRNRPDSQNYYPAQHGTLWQRAASSLNDTTGGGRFTPGWLDVSPATLENLARGYGGGPMMFTMDLINSLYARQSIERGDLEARRLPFAKQFYGQIDNETDRMTGYARLQDVQSKSEPVRAAARVGEMAEARQIAQEGGPLALLGDRALATRQALSEIAKREREIIDSKRSDGDKYALLQHQAAKKRQLLQDFNGVYDRAVQQTIGKEARK